MYSKHNNTSIQDAQSIDLPAKHDGVNTCASITTLSSMQAELNAAVLIWTKLTADCRLALIDGASSRSFLHIGDARIVWSICMLLCVDKITLGADRE